MLYDMDIRVCRTPDGYKCEYCVPDEGEPITFYPSREALWREHLFCNVLNWVNEKLAPAHWLRVSRSKCGSTWAELVMDESKLTEQERTMLLTQQLKSIDGQPAYESSLDGGTNWLVPFMPSKSQVVKEMESISI